MVPPGATVRGGGGEDKKVEVGLREGRWVGQKLKKKKKKSGVWTFPEEKRDRTREKKDESQEEESKSVRGEAREKKR